MTDSTMIGRIAAQTMESISDDFTEGQKIRTVVIVVELDDDNDSHIVVAASDPRPWLQIALLNEGVLTLEDYLAARRQGE